MAATLATAEPAARTMAVAKTKPVSMMLPAAWIAAGVTAVSWIVAVTMAQVPVASRHRAPGIPANRLPGRLHGYLRGRLDAGRRVAGRGRSSVGAGQAAVMTQKVAAHSAGTAVDAASGLAVVPE